MARQVRNRLTGVLLGGLILGAPLLATGTAAAGQVGGDPYRVIFHGSRVFGLTCDSFPDVESLQVPADGVVTVVNRTGRTAELLIGGRPSGELRDHGRTEVVFHRGTTAVALDPDCTITDPVPVLITSLPAGPAIAPVQPTGPSVPGHPELPDLHLAPIPTAPGGHRHATAAGIPSIRPDRTSPAHSRPATPQRQVAAAEAPGPAVDKIKNSDLRRTHAAARPTADPARRAAGSRVPNRGGSAATAAPPAAVTVPPAPVARSSVGALSSPAAEPVVALRPVASDQPIGLLALVASVCVVGVGIGVIRALVSQRAYRAEIA